MYLHVNRMQIDRAYHDVQNEMKMPNKLQQTKYLENNKTEYSKANAIGRYSKYNVSSILKHFK